MTSTSHTTIARATTVRQVLVQALAKISRPSGWCKGTPVRSREGLGYVAFCASAAVRRTEARRPYLTEAACNVLRGEMNGDIIRFNDHSRTRKYMVIRAFKNAIAKA